MNRIKNLDKLNQKLERIAAINLTAGILKGCLRVERDAKIFAPVDTGLLRESITHNVSENSGEVGTSIEYAPKVELGLGQNPQPYLMPALEKNRAEIRNDISSEMKKQLGEILK